MTPASFECYRGLLEPAVDPLGWSAVPLFAYACSEHCQGVLDETTMYDSSKGTYDYQAVLQRTATSLARNSNPSPPESEWGVLVDPQVSCGGREAPPVQQWPLILHSDQTKVKPELEAAFR